MISETTQMVLAKRTQPTVAWSGCWVLTAASARARPAGSAPTLLLLDEATSSLDVATETRVTEAMRRLRQGRTTIVIAHRLSTVIEADQLAVIEDGRVAEAGPPARLLTRGGQFADLYERWLAGAA